MAVGAWGWISSLCLCWFVGSASFDAWLRSVLRFIDMYARCMIDYDHLYIYASVSVAVTSSTVHKLTVPVTEGTLGSNDVLLMLFSGFVCCVQMGSWIDADKMLLLALTSWSFATRESEEVTAHLVQGHGHKIWFAIPLFTMSMSYSLETQFCNFLV